jgi:cation/acetate symporter
MNDRRTFSQARIDGRALFFVAAYLVGVGLIFLLERIGAPDGLVRVLCPLLALSAIALIGALTRTTRMAAFYAGDRAGSPLYIGAAFTGVAVGLAASISLAAPSAPPFIGLAIGSVLAATIVGPLGRRTGASSLRDIVSARFDNRIFGFVFGLVYLAIGVLITSIGYESAVETLGPLLNASRHDAIIVVAVIVLFVVAPGGLAGFFWVAAAAAGMIALVLFLPIGSRIATDINLGAPLLGGGGEAAEHARDLITQYKVWPLADPWLNEISVALGVAVLPPLSAGAFVGFTSYQASRVGFSSIVIVILFAAAFALGAPLWRANNSVAGQSLLTSGLLVAALICAASGAQTASRAASAHVVYGREGVLASQRLARARGFAILAIGVSAWLAYRQAIVPEKSFFIATAISLALLGPPLALSFSARAQVAHAIAAAIVTLVTMAALAYANGWAVSAMRAPTIALIGAFAGFAVGWAASAFGAPRRQELEAAPSALFIDSPFDHGGV